MLAGKNSSSDTRQVAGLDVVRFAAAAWVMVFHLGFLTWANNHSTAHQIVGSAVRYPEFASFSWFGWVGVEVFFVLSGFVIAYTANHSSPFLFLRSRVLRLAPAAWICASITATVLLLLNQKSTAVIFKSYVHTVMFWPKAPWVDGVYWTLGIEISFYAVIFVLLCLNKFQHIGVVASAIGCASSLFWLGDTASQVWPGAFPHINGLLHRIQMSRTADLLLIHHGCFFATGVLLWLSSIKRWAHPWVFAVCISGGLLEIMQITVAKNVDIGQSFPIFVPCLVWLVALALMWGSVVGNEWVASRLTRFVNMRRLGLMTYPLYLIHDAVGAALLRSAIEFGLPRMLALVCSMAAVLFLSWAVAAHGERPIRSALGTLISRAGTWLSPRMGASAFLFSLKAGV